MIGICPQFNVQFEVLTVKENLRTFAEIKGIKSREVEREVRGCSPEGHHCLARAGKPLISAKVCWAVQSSEGWLFTLKIEAGVEFCQADLGAQCNQNYSTLCLKEGRGRSWGAGRS